MSKLKECGRCKASFKCDAENISNCGCHSIVIEPAIDTFLKKTDYDCLCNDCLTELNSYVEMEKNYPFPSSPAEYIPKIHYYIENGFWVFTEYFHYLKGRCCQNGCRHCAYGFKA